MMRQIASPEVKPAAGALFLITTTMTCPVCIKNWKFQYLESAKSQAELTGFYKTEFEEKTYWRFSTEKAGVHALCGKCRANNIAVHIIHKPGQNAEVKSGWTQENESKLRGNLKYQQGKFAAWASVAVVANEAEAQKLVLADEQNKELREILPHGKIAIHIDWKESRA